MLRMISRTIILVMLLCLFAEEALAQNALTLAPFFSGVTKIDPSAIKASPRWKVGEENPPVSARKAIELATREIKRFDKTIQYDRDEYRWKFRSIELIPPQRYENWYWVAKFDFENIHVSQDDLFEQVWVPVLMSGRVVKLVLPDPPKEMNPDGIDMMSLPQP